MVIRLSEVLRTCIEREVKMLGFFEQDPVDPWKQKSDKGYEKSLAALGILAGSATKSTKLSSKERTRIEKVAHKLVELLQSNPEYYENNYVRRKFFLFKVPELTSVIVSFEGQWAADAPTKMLNSHRDLIAAGVDSLCALCDTLVDKRVREHVDEADVAMEVSFPSPSEISGNSNNRGSLGRLTGALGKTVVAVSGVADKSVGVAQGATARGRGVVRAAGLVLSSMSESSIDQIRSPIEARLKAVGTAGTVVIIGGALVSLVIPVVGAPLVLAFAGPVSREVYKNSLGKNLNDAEFEKKLRKQGYDEKIAKAMAQMRGERFICSETDHLSAKLDMETGILDGMILSGKFCGFQFSDLSDEDLRLLLQFAPDKETGDLLSRFQEQKST